MDFGAFVTICPGKDGLVHVSQISNERVEKVGDKLKEGDMVKVKVLEVDKQGRIRLSMKAVEEGEGVVGRVSRHLPSQSKSGLRPAFSFAGTSKVALQGLPDAEPRTFAMGGCCAAGVMKTAPDLFKPWSLRMTSRRDLLKFGTLAAAAAAIPAFACRAGPRHRRQGRQTVEILILGGTGFTGPFQVNYALARGHKVTLFNRGKRPSPEWPGEVEQLHGDRNTGDLKSLQGRKWDVCIDNPTSLPFWVRDAAKVLKGNVDHYMFISTISVYADGSTHGIDENSPLAVYKGKDAMAETQDSLRADMEILRFAEGAERGRGAQALRRTQYHCSTRQSSARATRPTASPTGRSGELGGEMLVPGDGQDPIQIIDGRDLGEWMCGSRKRRPWHLQRVGPDYTLTTDAMVYGCQAVTDDDLQLTHATPKFIDGRRSSCRSGCHARTTRTRATAR